MWLSPEVISILDQVTGGVKPLDFSHPSDLGPAPTWRRGKVGAPEEGLWPSEPLRDTEPVGCTWHAFTFERDRVRGVYFKDSGAAS